MWNYGAFRENVELTVDLHVILLFEVVFFFQTRTCWDFYTTRLEELLKQ